MNIAIDTDNWLECQRCDATIEPWQRKLVLGINVDGHNEVMVLCFECAIRHYAIRHVVK